jgi:hypothetical protein
VANVSIKVTVSDNVKAPFAFYGHGNNAPDSRDRYLYTHNVKPGKKVYPEAKMHERQSQRRKSMDSTQIHPEFIRSGSLMIPNTDDSKGNIMIMYFLTQY